MKRFALAALAALSTGAASANAATLNFLAEANAQERGIANVAAGVSNLTLSGVRLRLDARDTNTGAAYLSYLDSGNAGLGVCKSVDNASQCVPSSDDNVTQGESVLIQFLDGPLNIDGIAIRLEGHVPPTTTAELAKTLLIAVNGGALTQYTFAQVAALAFANISSIRFAFDDANLRTTADQFYLSSLTVSQVPVPAALPLLLSGLAGLGFSARRRKTA